MKKTLLIALFGFLGLGLMAQSPAWVVSSPSNFDGNAPQLSLGESLEATFAIRDAAGNSIAFEAGNVLAFVQLPGNEFIRVKEWAPVILQNELKLQVSVDELAAQVQAVQHSPLVAGAQVFIMIDKFSCPALQTPGYEISNRPEAQLRFTIR